MSCRGEGRLATALAAVLALAATSCRDACQASDLDIPAAQPAPGRSVLVDGLAPAIAADWESRRHRVGLENPPRGVGWWPRLAVAEDGTLHLAYCDADYGYVKHAERPEGGSWAVVTASAAGGVGKYLDLGLWRGQPVVGFYDQVNRLLLLGARVAGQWRFEQIARGLEVGFGNRLLVDDAGGVHLFYYTSSGRLMHSQRLAPVDGASGLAPATGAWPPPLSRAERWRHELVTESGGSYSIRLDARALPDGGFQLSYLDWDMVRSRFKLGVREGGSWRHELVDDYEAPGWHSSIVSDPEGLLLVYDNSRNQDLWLARPDGEGGWRRWRWRDSVNHVRAASDQAGELYVAHVGAGVGLLSQGWVRLLVRRGATWSLYDVDTRRPTGAYLDLALDRRGRPVLAYFDGTTFGLRVYSED